jgi:methionine aminopeptidase
MHSCTHARAGKGCKQPSLTTTLLLPGSSVNEIICHGIPDIRPLQDGDIVNLDISVYYKVLRPAPSPQARGAH